MLLTCTEHMKTLKDKIEEILQPLFYYDDSVSVETRINAGKNKLLSIFEEMCGEVIKELENLKSAEYVQDMRSDRNTLIRYFIDKQRTKLKELVRK